VDKPVLRLGRVLFLALGLGLLPGAGSASEFTLGGFVRLDTFWDSTQVNNNLTQFINRDNDPNFQHGRVKFSPQVSRMWFLIKGPKIWGAETSGYIEWDYDDVGNVNLASGGLPFSVHKSRLALRHAFFRLNWPETELFMGQYFGLLTEEFPEVANAGAQSTGGNIYFREPQIRLTQKFLDAWTASVSISEPMNGATGTALVPDQQANGNPFTGESSETPRVTARLKYEKDLWGKGPYMGVPRAFAARLAGSFQRSRFRSFTGAGRIFGEANYTGVNVTQRDQQYLNQWVAQGSVFVPIIPTYTKDLSRTMALLTQWYVGAGMDFTAEDVPANASYLSLIDGTLVGDRQLLKRYGGFVELQYYFTNEWYINADWGINRAFDLNRGNWAGTSTSADPVKNNQQYYLTLWYRPIQALKFGLEYVYVRSDYFQNVQQGSQTSSVGEDHRLVFTAFFFF